MTRPERLKLAPQNKEEWQRHYQSVDKGYLRVRLNAIKCIWEGMTMNETCIKLNIDVQTLRKWLDLYLEAGFPRLLEPITHNKPEKLNMEKKKILHYIVLHKSPMDYHFDSYLWNAKFLIALIKEKWDIDLKDSRIYEILDELGLSLQKFHRDYKEADPIAQRNYAINLKKN